MTDKKSKSVFMEGAITSEFIGNSIYKHQTKTNIGAHNIFLGQVRADVINDKTVLAITYTAYLDMANQKFHEIRESAFEKFELTCMHIYHSLGTVKAGEICLFVFVSAPRRKVVFEALEYIVEAIKQMFLFLEKRFLKMKRISGRLIVKLWLISQIKQQH